MNVSAAAVTPMSSTSLSHQQELREADRLLRMRNASASEAICARVLAANPSNIDAHLIRARARQLQGLYDGMLACTDAAIAIDATHSIAQLIRIEALTALGEITNARNACDSLKGAAGRNDPTLLGRVAELETQLGAHATALQTLRRAFHLQPDAPEIAYSLATAELAAGDIERAETLFDFVIARSPGDADACYNRSTLRTQTPERNHITELETRLRNARDARGEFGICYALAKEHEDLGDYDASFSYLKRGADARHSLLQYRVETDIAAMKKIAATFNADFFARDSKTVNEEGAVFIVGLPRSGTTLVDRILSGHPDIESVGEVNDLALAITRYGSGAENKESLIERAASMELTDIARQYRRATTERSEGARFVIDKTPLNFLYLGIIAKAMPNAKIIHVERDPMDVGFAMYKTLFRMGYPFSYNLTEIARYIRAKTELMNHWREMIGDRVTTISYESLIADQEGESRRLFSAFGLAWRPECLEFHKNAAPTATASAAQVRQPLYSSSVGKWRHYEKHLSELSAALV